MASVVVLGLGDSKLSGLATAGDYCSFHRESFQSKRTEQKAPRDLNTAWIFAQNLTVRGSLCGSVRAIHALLYLPYALVPAPASPGSLCLQPHSCGSTRAPPLMDPPLFS